ncbi:MAG: M20/M25/M40 family metallo-hydrolase, partial [Gemmatimonadetes bacterium]|nr:M20/M25/M40 family metallo-hydrolase [Gemmatimonadota bacterium]
MATDIDTLVSAVDEDWIVERTRELVEVESETLDEQEVCALFERQMRGLGLDVDVREVTPGRNNLYARIPGSGRGPALLFNGHLDTIAVGGCPPCRLEGDRLYGRGSTDMKGGVASMLG